VRRLSEIDQGYCKKKMLIGPGVVMSASEPLKNREQAAQYTLSMKRRRYRSEEWLRTDERAGRNGVPFEVHHRRACARREFRLKHLEMVGEAGVRCGGPATVGGSLTFEV
jgi:hypothetical protein